MRLRKLRTAWSADDQSTRRRLTMCAATVVFGSGAAITACIGNSTWGERLNGRVERAFAAQGTSELFHHAYDTNVNVEHVVILACVIAFVLAWLWWGPRRAILVVASIAVAGASSELLKTLSLVPPPSGAPSSGSPWPSAHAAALTALDASAMMLAWS